MSSQATLENPLLEKIRTQWKDTDTGKDSNAGPENRELEFYWSSMKFSIQLRLETIARKMRENQSVSEVVLNEKSHIEQELHLCTDIVRLLLGEQ